MEKTRGGWLRGALTVGVAGSLAAVAIIAPVGAVAEKKEASKKFVKTQVAGVTSQVDTLKGQLGSSLGSNDGPTPLGDSLTTVATLSLTPGTYAIFAKTALSQDAGDPEVNCELRVGGATKDTAVVELAPDEPSDLTVALTTVHTLAAAGTADLACRDETSVGGDASAAFSKITSVEAP